MNAGNPAPFKAPPAHPPGIPFVDWWWAVRNEREEKQKREAEEKERRDG